jgi:serine/threonine protein kinase
MKDSEGHTPRRALPEGLPAEPQNSFDPAKSAVLEGRSELPSGIHLQDTVPVLANWAVQAAQRLSEASDSTTADPPVPADDTTDAIATFRLAHQIGRGGFGEVWEAVQVSLGRVVAVKRLRPDLIERVASDPGRLHALELSFHQEAVTTASLEHPNIVPIHDLGRDSAGRPVLAMKRLRGRTWEELIRGDFPKLPVADFLGKHLPILVDVSQAVAFAHSRGVIHRDLKPSQVMAGEFGEVLLLDWGLAVAHDPELLATHAQEFAVSIAPTCESATNPAGTPAFMAPEQTEPTAANVGPWTDIFLLGGTLYYLLCGIAPHHTEDSAQSFYRASEGIIELPEKRNSRREVPAELSNLAMHAMSFKPEDRPGDVAEFIARVSDYLTGASKRREAAALIADVEKRLAGETANYRSLSECAVSLARAEGLWPGNERSKQLGERTIEAHANVAFANGDYTLARQQAERLEDLTLRSRLTTEIDAVVSANAKALRQRKHFPRRGGYPRGVLHRRVSSIRSRAERKCRSSAPQRSHAGKGEPTAHSAA